MATPSASSELITRPDGRIYHLDLLPGEIAPVVLLVGDPGRVASISTHFDKTLIKRENREFRTHTGVYQGAYVTALSTGIGTDNIDIVVNELNALCHLMPESQQAPDRLTLLRIGTCGALQPSLSPGSVVVTRYAVGLDNIAQFYATSLAEGEQALQDQLAHHWRARDVHLPFYTKGADEQVYQHFSHLGKPGVTLTAPGFYGPQARYLGMPAGPYAHFLDALQSFTFGDLAVQNLEMESSALYALGPLMGHRCLTVSLALANRTTGEALKGYHTLMSELIKQLLNDCAPLSAL